MPEVPDSTDALPPDPQFPASVPADLTAAWRAARTDEERAMALLEVAYFLEDFSKWQAAEIGKYALHYAKRSENRILIARTLLSISFVLGEGARFTEAFGYLSQTIALAHTMPEEGRQILLDALVVRGTLRHNLGDEHGSQRDFLSILSQEGEASDPITLLLARVNLVGVYAAIQQPEVALHHSRLAGEQLSAIVKAHKERGESLRHEDHYRLGVTETRLAAFLEFARHLRKLHRPEAMRGALDEAEALLDVAVQLAGADDNIQQHMLLQVHAAYLKLLRNDQPGAEVHALRAAALTDSLGSSIFPEAYLALARVLNARGAGLEAAEAYRQALDIARKCGRHRVIQEVLGELSELHEQQGDLSGALRVMREALSHARKALQVIDQAEFVDVDTTAPRSPAEGLHFTWQERLRLAEQEAQQDPLTGLLNRRGLDINLQRLRHEHAGSHLPLLVALLDIDHFKSVNDRHSHTVGDSVLRTVAHLLTDTARSDTLLARYGGEEFLLVTRVTDHTAAHSLLERCRAVIEEHDWTPLLGDRPLTISIGYALGQPVTFAAALNAADQHLYTAKQAGRNRVHPVERALATSR